uniref:Xylanolytic transcriptional activator regulatory domain-containing protein n=1 Tax=Bionectria ochroleuca TaxID=29856 RepID=A0A8H7KCV2_BIOOC
MPKTPRHQTEAPSVRQWLRTSVSKLVINAELASDGKLDSLDQRLERMGRLVENLVAENRPGTRATSSASPLNESDPSPGVSISSGFGTSSPPVAPRVNLEQPKAQGTVSSAPAQEQQEGNSIPVTEGPSSFSAQSDFAVAFLKKVAGSDRDQGHVFDSLELQDALGHIVDVLHKQQGSLDMAFSATDAPAPVRVRPKMPPIEASVAVIKSTEDRAKIIIYHLSSVIDVPSISDMCLKVYFSQDYSDAELIILNAVLYFLFGQHDDQEENKAICAENLTNALARLSLYIKPSFDMTFALILGAVFAMESFKPLVSCTLITAAYQAAYSLGYHTRQKGADKGSDSPNKAGLLFWAIYFLERSFALGLGRSSTIPNSDITVPLPGGPKFPLNSGMNAYRNMVRTARLSGRVYEDLYSAEALHLPANVRQQKVAELTGELQDIRETHRQVREAIPINQSDPVMALKMKQLVEFIYHSDEIHCLSILTLIQRAAPLPLQVLQRPSLRSASYLLAVSSRSITDSCRCSRSEVLRLCLHR